MKTILLNGVWKLRGLPQEGDGEEVFLDATVPGCVLLDLSKAGLLPEDLYLGENILETEKYENYEWWYQCIFSAPAQRSNAFLVFEGVDCLAEYYLNDSYLGKSENMMISHEFYVGDLLREGENSLTVHIRSAVIGNHDQNYTAAAMMTWENAPVQTGIRRAPHTYGWDIMPRAIMTGIWRDAKLELRDRLYFSQLYFRTTDKTCTLLYEIAGKWSDFRDVTIEAEGSCGDSRFCVRHNTNTGKAGRFEIPIEDPRLWWPYGYGDPNVYDATVKIYSRGELVHEEQASFGLRRVELDRTDSTDGYSGRFRFLINGVEIMCKGSNWVPMDAFHCRDAQRYDRALALAKDIGCNILRCWGGNVYEDHSFYDFCDRNGIMVWQDFSMACRIYPDTQRYIDLMEGEVTQIVRKLRNHPSIILWAGDNEIDLVISKFADPSINRITREQIPQILSQNDLDRPYLPSSPYISKEVYENKPRLSPSEDHVWGPRDYFKSRFYTENRAHFISEIGYHGCPGMDSIRKFTTHDMHWPYRNNPQWILHSSDQRGNDSRMMLMEKQIRQLFGTVPADPDRFSLASQISQAEANKFFIERMRIGRPRKTGIIWWNLIDGWPQFSDAVVDYYYEKKLAYYYIKRSQVPFCIAIDEIFNWNSRIMACNDTLKTQIGHFTVTDLETKEILLQGDFSAKENSTTCIGSLPLYYSERRMLLIQWEANGRAGYNHYLCGYPPFDLGWYEKLLKELEQLC